MASKSTKEKVYAELDDLCRKVSLWQHQAYAAMDFDDASWLACVEDVLVKFSEDDFDDLIDGAGERRFDRASERAFDEPSGADQLLHLQAEARKLK